MPKVYSYARVSSADQVDNTSLTTQRETADREYEYRWKSQGYERGEHFEDRSVSGSKPLVLRPQGHKLNVTAERGDVILFPKLDRGFRSAKDILITVDIWLARGVRPIFIDQGIDAGTPMGRCMITVGAAFAELERSRIIERIRDGVRKRLAEGKPIGNAPWGTRYLPCGPKAKRLEVIVEDYELGEYICTQYEQGHSVYQIASHLMKHDVQRRAPKSEQGVNYGKRAKRKEWSESAVYRTLKRQQHLRKVIAEGRAKFPKGYIAKGSDNATAAE